MKKKQASGGESDAQDQDVTTEEKSVDEKAMHYVPYGVTSFSELDSAEETKEMIEKASLLMSQFGQMADNILYEDVEDKPSRLTGLVKEFSERFMGMFNADGSVDSAEVDGADEEEEDSEIVYASKSVCLFKAGGDYYFLGRPTNKWRDVEGEILSSKSHEWYVGFINKYPQYMPELWVWHEEGTQIGEKAVWADYADGHVSALWPVSEAEAARIEEWCKDYEPGMSHGFVVIERKDDTIEKYYSFEASILPRDFAANDAATFHLLGGEKMAFNGTQRDTLVKLLGEDRVVALEEHNEKDAAHLSATRDFKSADGQEGGNDTSAAILAALVALGDKVEALSTGKAKKEETPAPVASQEEEDGGEDEETKMTFEEQIVKALEALEARVNGQISKLEDGVEAVAELVVGMQSEESESFISKAAAMPPATLAAFIQKGSVLESQEARVRKDNNLVNGPDEGDETDLMQFMLQMGSGARE